MSCVTNGLKGQTSCHPPEPGRKSTVSQEGRVSPIKSWGKFPIYFIENRGQTDLDVGYYVKGSGKTLFFGSEGVTISIQEPRESKGIPGVGEAEAVTRRWNLKLNFIGANQGVRPEGEGKTGARFNYFKGSREDWKTRVDTYRQVRYRELWPGIDLLYSGSTDLLKQDFIIRPGGDPAQIRFACLGAESIEIGAHGVMNIETPFGGFQDARPEAYQMAGEERVKVDVLYDLKKTDERYEYRFRLGPYDRSRELIIDPATVIYAGFIGGSGNSEIAHAIKVDSSGNTYVVGETDSTESTFPETGGPDLVQNGGADAFVAKVSADGSSLTYAGFIGGSGTDKGYGIAIDGNGNAYLTGETNSSEATFPETGGPDLTQNGGVDAFVAKVSADGSSLTYAGFIGGSGTEIGRSIAVDSSGNAYVSGATIDAFVAKVSADGSSLTYAGFIGGSQDDFGRGIAVDSSGNAYIAGEANSTEATFPETVGPDLTQNGGSDLFVAKVSADGSSLTYAGFIGGSGQELTYNTGIAVDTSGQAFVTGETNSSEATFPETGGPDLVQNGGVDAFVAKVSADGSSLTYAGFIGGSGTDRGYGIVVDSGGNATITGETDSTESTFPETGGPDLTQNGGIDAFVAKVSADGSSLTYAGFIGGSG
ncbi:MAG: SBBP repeat-containing protein, partial [Deltaproteobacteria bacterium]|nr:SBBP repeat-containing protein [Deltaproteobacteria bacterium]